MTDVRITQAALEVIRAGNPAARLSQVAVEVLRKTTATVTFKSSWARNSNIVIQKSKVQE